MNLVRLGITVRALRRRHGWRQLDLARRAQASQQTISRLERGRSSSIPLATAARVMGALEADLDLVVNWRGGALERILDERHAALAGVAAARLDAARWRVVPEVSYAEYAERGSIDLLGMDEASRILLVVEVKTELVSIEATLRKHDEKRRLVSRIVRSRFGLDGPWRIRGALVLPDTGASRRRVAGNAAILDRVYPLRGREASAWLRDRTTSAAPGAVLFLPLTHGASGSRASVQPHRVRTRARTRNRAQPAPRAHTSAAVDEPQADYHPPGG